ncbi:hypothetical protein CEUSTIGMA_g12616.t1 [Chlamydomonas eustigma]|uniref:RWD domain-containing protein n=1 Tax=Chlamydomonas eustigma TaxID=1157962 RepID=A0A250XQ46_9CHLO|nr:hypothetical protein CEUSTIGMA_g12616.t1 [Chlamydomonas eustigma]|eukprot:GAX85197.1 hypothetical protein CEUSTIGMA_g12616.t1 [Chlamydomonas eustigma]
MPHTPVLRILCLHGSRQNAELFSRRIKDMETKLRNTATFCYVDAPHTVPLASGQMVPMRTWWRHKGMSDELDEQEGASDTDEILEREHSEASLQEVCTAAHNNEANRPQKDDSSNQHFPNEGRPPIRQQLIHEELVEDTLKVMEVREAQASWRQALVLASELGWHEVMVQDWKLSYQALKLHWESVGGYDGVLGFSNGAAAAALFAINLFEEQKKNPNYPCPQFLIMVGGYLAEPLSSLVPEHLVQSDGPVSRLRIPLSVPSLHILGKSDCAVTPEESLSLAGRVFSSAAIIREHEGGHCVPQRAADIKAYRDFLAAFTPAVGQTLAARPYLPHYCHETLVASLFKTSCSENVSQSSSVATKHSSSQMVSSLVTAANDHVDEEAIPSQGGSGKEQQATEVADTEISLGMTISRQPEVTKEEDGVLQIGFPVPSEQLEELQVLEAIFGGEYHCLQPPDHPTPITVLIKLVDPASSVGAEAGEAAASSVGAEAGEAAYSVGAEAGEAADTAGWVVNTTTSADSTISSNRILLHNYNNYPLSTAIKITTSLQSCLAGQSSYFVLVFSLPQEYPGIGTPPNMLLVPPHNHVKNTLTVIHGQEGWMRKVHELLSKWALEALEETGGSGCIYQVVELAKEHISATFPGGLSPLTPLRLPATIASGIMPASQPSRPPHAHVGAEDGGNGGGKAAAAEFAVHALNSPSSASAGIVSSQDHTTTSQVQHDFNHWWDKEQADAEMIKKAIKEASAVHWRLSPSTIAGPPYHDVHQHKNESTTARMSSAAIAADGFGCHQSLQLLKGEQGRVANKQCSIQNWGNDSGGNALDDQFHNNNCQLPRPATEEFYTDIHTFGDLAQKGRWDYCVGLVGKPSAGKSTFYNAVVDPVDDKDGARVAAFPFTTIAPNIGRGTFVVPDPALALGLDKTASSPAYGLVPGFSLERVSVQYNNIAPLKRWLDSTAWTSTTRPASTASTASLKENYEPSSLIKDGHRSHAAGHHGHVRDAEAPHHLSWRRVPVTIKDVAGLVPGAYQGRGRGNAFLNDLTDADVLIHVVDVSGSTDKEGGQLQLGDEGGDPLDEIGWVREELHRWVFDNIRTKWPNVIRRPSHLPDLFSGYRASRALVYKVLERVGLSFESLIVEGASLDHWDEARVHQLVATFLQMRFPILLALNKADMSGAAHHIERVRSTFPHEPAVAVSAATERWLCSQRRKSLVSYQDASDCCKAAEGSVINDLVAMEASDATSQQGASRSSKECGNQWNDEAAKETPLLTQVPTSADNSDKKAVLATKVTSVAQCASHDVHDDDMLECNVVHGAPANDRNCSSSSREHMIEKQVDIIQRRVLKQYGSTGALLALTTAIAMRPPRVVFPVADLQSCTAIPARVHTSTATGGGPTGSGAEAKARQAEGSHTRVLRDCVLLKPGSTVEDLYWVLKRPPYLLLDGDFVRSDCRLLSNDPYASVMKSQSSTYVDGSVVDAAHRINPSLPAVKIRNACNPHRVLKKTELMDFSNCVCRIMTNKRAQWQKSG